ncbi:MAG: 16S rRNA (guanine(966)-N(2))-methyltransferase RsmD [Alphaproteobacteria bacterium]|nr:MAG: 16S rRNA (guanine(966)-N(2))-methyltransferase RsmD [Alphaproteobacteria bacterium]
MTRIIAGRHRGRRLQVPEGTDIRPTTDRMRERLFSMLAHARYPDMDGAHVADLFAGTGALGLEALSRGAAHATFAEQAPGSVACLKANIATLKEEGRTSILRADATRLPRATQACDVIFMDPPYRKGLVAPALAAVLSGCWLAEDGVIVVELAADDPTEFPIELDLVDDRRQGQQRIVFLKRCEG